MKKVNLVLLLSFLFVGSIIAQNETGETKKKLYNPEEDAKTEIANAVKQAKEEGKHVFLQVGGNWCGWCLLFDKKVSENDTLQTALNENYIVYHVNYSRENTNEEVMASLGFPQRFGFPVFVILDGDGNRLHTQDSGYLEQGKGHNTDKVLTFFRNWSPKALDPKNYMD
jgi:thioredoxin-related protein